MESCIKCGTANFVKKQKNNRTNHSCYICNTCNSIIYYCNECKLSFDRLSLYDKHKKTCLTDTIPEIIISGILIEPNYSPQPQIIIFL